MRWDQQNLLIAEYWSTPILDLFNFLAVDIFNIFNTGIKMFETRGVFNMCVAWLTVWTGWISFMISATFTQVKYGILVSFWRQNHNLCI